MPWDLSECYRIFFGQCRPIGDFSQTFKNALDNPAEMGYTDSVNSNGAAERDASQSFLFIIAFVQWGMRGESSVCLLYFLEGIVWT